MFKVLFETASFAINELLISYLWNVMYTCLDLPSNLPERQEVAFDDRRVIGSR